jgi:nucleotide-binding universal stress UspA family protein
MKKILVPTDLSPASKSGIRFAIQWASQQRLEIVFIHVLNIMIPTSWSKISIEKYVAGEIKLARQRFDKFISGIYEKVNVKPGAYSTTIIQGYDAGQTILEYCETDPDLDCICMSTMGAGKMMKIFGTNTSFLISKSKIPVIAIPKNYKAHAIRLVLYPTDFRNYQEELALVIKFASSFKAPVSVVHFAGTGEIPFDEKIVEAASGNYKPGLEVSSLPKNDTFTLSERLQSQIKKRRPSVVIMFTKQDRTLFQRIFSSSQTHEVSFQLNTPLLVYPKKKSINKTTSI